MPQRVVEFLGGIKPWNSKLWRPCVCEQLLYLVKGITFGRTSRAYVGTVGDIPILTTIMCYFFFFEIENILIQGTCDVDLRPNPCPLQKVPTCRYPYGFERGG